MLEQASRPQREPPLSAEATPPTFLLADARQLPFASNSFDVAFSSYGALPFVKDAEVVFAEVARVVRPGGQWVFSTTHPMRWMFPDVNRKSTRLNSSHVSISYAVFSLKQ